MINNIIPLIIPATLINSLFLSLKYGKTAMKHILRVSPIILITLHQSCTGSVLAANVDMDISKIGRLMTKANKKK